MAPDTAFQKRIQRIGETIEQLESAADPNTKARAKELVESLMALHGAALERMLELTSEAGDAGESIILKCGHDELVSSLLLLYGLHPEDLRSRVTRAVEKSQAYLEPHAARAELVSINDDGAVMLRLHLKSGGCGSSGASVKSTFEALIQDAAPDATSISIEEVGTSLTGTGFVPLARLQSGESMASSVNAQRSAD